MAHNMRATVGDVVVAYDQRYTVVEINDWGQYVCRNLSPDCFAHNEIRTFDDYDLDTVTRRSDPALFAGMGI